MLNSNNLNKNILIPNVYIIMIDIPNWIVIYFKLIQIIGNYLKLTK